MNVPAGSDLAANALGLAGFAILMAAPLARRRRRFVAIDAAGLAPVIAHYLWLNAAAGAAYSALYAVMNIAALVCEGRTLRRAAWALAVAAAALIPAFGADLAAVIAAGATIAAFLARTREDHRARNVLVAASAAGWLSYGLLAGSWAQAAFSSVYGAVALAAIAPGLGRASGPPRDPGRGP